MAYEKKRYSVENRNEIISEEIKINGDGKKKNRYLQWIKYPVIRRGLIFATPYRGTPPANRCYTTTIRLTRSKNRTDRITWSKLQIWSKEFDESTGVLYPYKNQSKFIKEFEKLKLNKPEPVPDREATLKLAKK